jgi:hypothetical protein
MSTLTTEDFKRGGDAYPSTWHFDQDLPEDRTYIEKTFKVLREYSGIPADKVEEHVIGIVRKTPTHRRRLPAAGVMPKLTPSHYRETRHGKSSHTRVSGPGASWQTTW